MCNIIINLRREANLSTKAKWAVPDGGCCSEVPLYIQFFLPHCLLRCPTSPPRIINFNPSLPPPPSLPQDRWLDCDLEKKQFLEGFVGFGGGRYQCPGKWFALMEMHLYVAMVIKMFDLKLKDSMPQTVRTFFPPSLPFILFYYLYAESTPLNRNTTTSW